MMTRKVVRSRLDSVNSAYGMIIDQKCFGLSKCTSGPWRLNTGICSRQACPEQRLREAQSNLVFLLNQSDPR